MKGLKTLGACSNLVVKFWFLTQNDEDVLLLSHQTSSMKHHLTETHKHNFEIHNIVLSSQSVSLIIGESEFKWQCAYLLALCLQAIQTGPPERVQESPQESAWPEPDSPNWGLILGGSFSGTPINQFSGEGLIQGRGLISFFFWGGGVLSAEW